MKKFVSVCFIILAFASSCLSINGTMPELNMGKQEVILTFDDGPNANGDTTARLLDVLKKYDVRAVFVLLGENAEKNPDLVKRIYDEGHIVASHGYADKWAANMTDEEFAENLIIGESAIAYALLGTSLLDTSFGEAPQYRFYRPHGGYYHKRHEKLWLRYGWTMLKCNIRAYDAVKTEADKQKVIDQIIAKTEKNKGGIILLHDSRGSHLATAEELAKNPSGAFNRAWIPAAVEEIIVALLAKGYKFTLP